MAQTMVTFHDFFTLSPLVVLSEYRREYLSSRPRAAAHNKVRLGQQGSHTSQKAIIQWSSEISQRNSSPSAAITASEHNNKKTLTSKTNLKSFKSIQRKPLRVTSLPEKRIVRVLEMQQHMGHVEEQLKKTKDRLDATEDERDQALDELKEMKKVAHEANMRLGEVMSSRKVSEVYTLSNSTRDSMAKEKEFESLKHDIEKAKQLELKLAEKDASLVKLKEEFDAVKTSEAHALDLLSESKKSILELEVELERRNESETKMLDSLASQTKQLEHTMISFEDSKLEIASLRQKVEELEDSSGKNRYVEDDSTMQQPLETLKPELQQAKENLARSQESEKLASSKAESLLKEMGLLKNQLKLATEADEKSKKALDDLALALKEVATEYTHTKEKLISTQAELEQTNEDAEELKEMIKNIEDKYKGLAAEAKKENDLLKNKVGRLRLEAEESIQAWNGREMGFVGCIKKVEEDRAASQQENKRLLESLLVTEKMTKVAKEENHKLRDIMKQALNEANVAKEAAGIARAENSQLKDYLAQKDEVLEFFSQEVENLRSNNNQAQENIKELNQKLSAAKELKSKDKEHGKNSKKHDSVVKEHHGRKKLGKTISLDLSELAIPTDEPKNVKEDNTEIAEALKGSIFDVAAETPPKIVYHHRKKSSSAFTEDGETLTLDDLDHLDVSHFDDMENDRNSHKKRLLRRFGDLLRMKSFHKKEQPVE